MIHISNFFGVQIRIDFSYLQIDAMPKWLHINRGSGCCNGTTLTSRSQSSPTCHLGTLQTSLLGEALEAPIFCHYLESGPDFENHPRKGAQILTILTRTSVADEYLKVSTPTSDDF